MPKIYKNGIIIDANIEETMEILKRLDETKKVIPTQRSPRVKGYTKKKGYEKKSIYWTNQEVEYLLDNFNRGGQELMYDKIFSRHTPQAVRTMYSTIRRGDKERMSKDLQKKLKERGIL